MSNVTSFCVYVKCSHCKTSKISKNVQNTVNTTELDKKMSLKSKLLDYMCIYTAII